MVATVSCSINGKQLKPAPLLTIQKEVFRGGVGDAIIGVHWLVGVNGTIVPTGSGGSTYLSDSDGAGNSGVGSVYHEKNQIFKAFHANPATFIAELGGNCSGAIMSGGAYVRSLSMDDSTDNYAQTATYSAELLFPNTTIDFDDIISGEYYLESVSTTYASEYGKKPFSYGGQTTAGDMTLTRTITAKALKPVGTMIEAATYVARNGGTAACPASASGVGFAVDIDADGQYDPFKTVTEYDSEGVATEIPDAQVAPLDIFPTGENTECFHTSRSFDWSETDGSFTQVDVFTKVASGDGIITAGYNVRDEFNWDCSFDWSAGGQNTLTVNGTAFGYAGFTPQGFLSGEATSAIQEAEGYYEVSQNIRLDHIKSQASGLSSKKAGGIHPEAEYRLQSHNVTSNPAEGTVSYSETYTTNAPFHPGVLSETVNVTRANQADVYAEQVILGRSAGPVLQNVGTKTAFTEEISIEAIVVPVSGNYSTMAASGGFAGAPDYDTLIDNHKQSILDRPEFSNGISIYKTSDSESYDSTAGRYTRNVGYIYVECGT